VRRGLLLLIISSVFFLPGGCDAPSRPLRVGTNVWPGYEPLYLARERGYLPESAVRLSELTSASDVMDALRLRHLEAGALTLDEALSLLAEGEDLVIVLVFDISAGADIIVARNSIESLPQLAGKTIALETNAVGALMLQSALNMAGLSPDQVTIRHMPPADHTRAFRAHRIDAAVTFEPYASELLRAGAHTLFDSRAIPGQIVDVLVVQRSALDEHRQQISTLIRAYFRAQEEIRQQPDKALPILNQRLKLSAENIPHMFDGLELPDQAANHRLLSGSPSPLERSAQQLAVLMKQQHLLSQSLTVNDITRPDFTGAEN